MVSKLPIIWKQTVQREREENAKTEVARLLKDKEAQERAEAVSVHTVLLIHRAIGSLC